MSMTLSELPDQLSAKIEPEPTSGCWLWTAATDPKGYGRVGIPGTRRAGLAHRIIYELLVGPIPDGLEMDHLCRNTSCVSPWHLEPVTRLVNVRRGNGGQYWATKTECPKGHPYDEANTSINGRGSRECRICIRSWTRTTNMRLREYKRAWRLAHRDEINARTRELRALRRGQP